MKTKQTLLKTGQSVVMGKTKSNQAWLEDFSEVLEQPLVQRLAGAIQMKTN